MSIEIYDITNLPELSEQSDRERHPATLGKCAHDDCARKLVAESIWDAADRATRKRWMMAGYYKVDAHRACRRHSTRVAAIDHNQLRRDEADRRARYFAGKYRGLVREGFKDPLNEIHHQTGVSIPQVRNILSRAGIDVPRRNVRAIRRDMIIEEVTFFLSMGRGLREISAKLELEEARLIEDLRRWKVDGLLEHLNLDWILNPDEYDRRNQYTAA